MNTALDLRTTNSLWASVLVETLARAGVRHAVVSPGSRSTPLTMALARQDIITTTPVLDERSAGFFALGHAKATGMPALLVCTSGTAAANYFPAVIEAHESAVPLIVITADRPPELRGCASGQTIDQQKLYGDYVGFYHEMAVPELEVGLFRYLRQTILHAVTRTLSPQPGPVHLNAPFRDPLAPVGDGGKAEAFAAGINWDVFFAAVEPTAVENASRVTLPVVADTHGLIVVGPNQPVNGADFAQGIGTLARRLGWPVLADGLSPLRNHADLVPNLVTTYDLILRNDRAADRLAPETVLAIGGWPTSKVLRGWLEKSDAVTWVVSDRSDNRDALHGRTRQLKIGLGALAAAVPDSSSGLTQGGYAGMWMNYERRARTSLDAHLENAAGMFEPKAAWLLARHLPANTPLFISNSMPIRDVEYVWPAGNRGIRPWCNRGANGIDGTLSTALGVAEATGLPSVLLTGDLAFLHDANGLMLRPLIRSSLTVVAINNRGGGIFEHLPVAQFEPPFERYFATPQEVDLAQLCAAHGVRHEILAGWDSFVAAISLLPANGVRVLELRTDRHADAAGRKKLFAELASSLI